MRELNCKYMTEAQQAEIGALWSEHSEAITAYVLDCVEDYKEFHKKDLMSGCIKSSMIGGAVVCIGTGMVYLGKKVYRKLKEKKEQKPWDKPGRDWEV